MEDEIIRFGSLNQELEISFSRSSGPGGQNVNKVNSKVQLNFNIFNSLILNDLNKSILSIKLSSKLSENGNLSLMSQTSRSQLENKEIVIKKFYALINKALKPVKKRFKTKPTYASTEKRLKAKKELSEKNDRRRTEE